MKNIHKILYDFALDFIFFQFQIKKYIKIKYEIHFIFVVGGLMTFRSKMRGIIVHTREEKGIHIVRNKDTDKI